MRTRFRFGGWLAVPIMCAALLGCAIVDQYSGRAIVYNLEAEQAQEQEILLNIVRAYLRRPMQFTTVSSITGTAIASASAQYALPTDVPFRPITQGATGIAAFPPLPTWLFSGSMSGGPAFTVPVLDTQEFYQGILKAIPGQIWDLYIQAGYPRDLLFNLFIEKVVMKRRNRECPATSHLLKCEFVFQNYAGDDIQIDLFQALGDYLLALGLTTEQSKSIPVPFVNPQNINVRYVGSPPSSDRLSEAQVLAPPGGSSSSGEQSSGRPYKICFAPPADANLVAPSSLCGASPKTGQATPDSQIKSSGSASVNLIASHEFVERLFRLATRDRYPDVAQELMHFDNAMVEITIYMRHTQGMIYYLGEVVRRALHAEFNQPNRAILIRENLPYQIQQQEMCRYATHGCGFVFRLNEGPAPAPGNFVAVNYSYCVTNHLIARCFERHNRDIAIVF
jgi:hypothetical protein